MMNRETDYDCIVVGAGVQGSFTGYELAKNNKKTLLLEQFVLPHSRGSSHGQTRIIRKAYDQDFYCHMLDECYKLWAQLEEEAGVKLYRQTGLLVMGPENSERYQAVKNTLQKCNVPMKVLTRENFNKHIPHVNLAEGDGAVVETMAGILYADRALTAVQLGGSGTAPRIGSEPLLVCYVDGKADRGGQTTVSMDYDVWLSGFEYIHKGGYFFNQGQFRKMGGVIRDNEPVTDIKPGPVVTVSTPVGDYRAKSVVITVGPWANKLLAPTGLQLPLEVLKINVCYWREKVPGLYNVKNGFPCFVVPECQEAKDYIYGLPSNEYPGLMKLCYHTGGAADPDTRDMQRDTSDIEILKSFITRCFPGLVPEPAVVESCLYTLTPDRNFVLDCHPDYKNIVIGAGFSGHGFKFAPLIGKLLHELSQGEIPSYDLSPFRVRRFQEKNRSAL